MPVSGRYLVKVEAIGGLDANAEPENSLLRLIGCSTLSGKKQPLKAE
jgi:hypothetical protein